MTDGLVTKDQSEDESFHITEVRNGIRVGHGCENPIWAITKGKKRTINLETGLRLFLSLADAERHLSLGRYPKSYSVFCFCLREGKELIELLTDWELRKKNDGKREK